jgi:hypothetical protein
MQMLEHISHEHYNANSPTEYIKPEQIVIIILFCVGLQIVWKRMLARDRVHSKKSIQL